MPSVAGGEPAEASMRSLQPASAAHVICAACFLVDMTQSTTSEQAAVHEQQACTTAKIPGIAWHKALHKAR